MSGILCSRHQAELYQDIRDGLEMGRWLCPARGCTSILADETIAAVRDQAWASDHGMLAPGWTVMLSPARHA